MEFHTLDPVENPETTLGEPNRVSKNEINLTLNDNLGENQSELKSNCNGEFNKNLVSNNVVLKNEDNPYAYLERSDFTSEKYKIEIRGLPKFYGIGELKKLLNDKLKLGSNKIKPPKRGSRWLYVCFRSEKDREDALKIINGYTWKNKLLTADIAKPAPDPLVKRRNENNGNAKKKIKIEDNRTQEEILKSNITPLWDMPYEEQLCLKTRDTKEILKNVGKEILKANNSLKQWVLKRTEQFDGLPCELHPIQHPQQYDGYRNKCEFTIGLNEETGEKTVGFRLGSYATGTVGVGPVHFLKNIPERVKTAAKIFEIHVRQSSLKVFDPETQSGFWRQLTVRLAMNTNELMLIVGMHPQELSNDELTTIKKELIDFFSNQEGQVLEVTSLYFQIIKKKQFGETLDGVEHLIGKTHITEKLSGLNFQISPLAFFQINTPAAELLYNSVPSLCELTQKTTLLDICCGIGTIGLSLAKHCGQVLGLEILTAAVEDARNNAALNSISNCAFFSGAAEEILSSVVSRATNEDVVAVVDPPRAGLRQKAVIMLRRTTRLNKMIYIACDIKAAFKNIIDLSRPPSKTMVGDPFVPIAAVPVDLFPHTRHCEIAIYFERINISELKNSNKNEADNINSDNNVNVDILSDKSKC
uniref:tRNA (uracil(54)-C(5))-methyltransferase n=2 Tax=Clastoptera arizonana TaxID=38151 RepID=A0A1B6D834_9HEMI